MKFNPTIILLFGMAVAGASLLSSGSSTHPYEDRLLEVAVHQSFGELAPQVTQEPREIQALLLDYADDEQLLLQTRLALLTYPDLAHRILPVYGDRPEFRKVLEKYGEAALPPIAYFMDHDLASLELRHTLGEWMDRLKRQRDDTGAAQGDMEPRNAASETGSTLTEEMRGWYAIHFLLDEGHDFLGQFTIGQDHTVTRVQTERILEGVSDFFFGGTRNLEVKWRTEENIDGSDWGWAALDVIVIAGSVKLLRAVRAARAGSYAAAGAGAGRFSWRVAAFGSRILARGGRMGIAVARFGAIPAAVYLMIRHPSLINSTLSEFAHWAGIEPWIAQFVFWVVALWIVFSLSRLLLGPLSLALRGLGRVAGSLAYGFHKPQV
jgi:hypothetical protein